MRVRSSPFGRGFSTVEMLIVAAIICIIAAIALPSLVNARRTERFRPVNELCVKHLKITLNDRVIDASKPYANWFSEDEKTITRPFVAKRLKTICEDAAGELALFQKAKQELLVAPLDDQHVGMNDRLEILHTIDEGLAYFSTATSDNGESCRKATEVAKNLDLLPK